MNRSDLTTLYEYSCWATARVLQAADGLEAEQFLATPQGYPSSLQATLLHVLSAERLWRIRLETGSSPEALRPEDVPTVALLKERWVEEQQAMRAYLGTLDDAALDRQVQFRRRTGDLSEPLVLWHLLMQLVTHGAAHRAEAAAMLTTFGQSPGDLDFLIYVLEQGRA